MNKLTESDIENLAVKLLDSVGYNYLHGSVIAPDGETPERASYFDVILQDRLCKAIANINRHIPESGREAAFKEVLHPITRLASQQ